jgi:hypothetical protein
MSHVTENKPFMSSTLTCHSTQSADAANRAAVNGRQCLNYPNDTAHC